MDSHTSQQPTNTRRKRPSTPTPEQPAASAKTCQCVIPASVPTYKSFRHIRNPKVRRAKEYEQWLHFLRDEFPEYNTGIDEQIAYARAQQGRSPASDRDRITSVLEAWPEGVTCGEVAEDLKMPYKTAYKILREFLETGFVVATERKGIAGNKPYLVYALGH